MQFYCIALQRTTDSTDGSIVWLGDLDFADDIAVPTDDLWCSMLQTSSVLLQEANKVGLFITNPDKCKVMTTSAWNDRLDTRGHRIRHSTGC